MSFQRESDALHRRVQAFIDAATRGDETEPFDALACDLARHQHRYVAPVRRLLDARGVDVATVDEAAAIPALPTDAFRLRRIAPDETRGSDARVFHTSGTTADARGRHPMRRLDTYRRGALGWGRSLLFPDETRMRVVALLDSEDRAPGSSLTFMAARFAEALGNDATYHWDGERLDVDGAVARLRSASSPVLLAGTSFAFVIFLDALGDRTIELPARSRVMQTGGFKGRSREVDASTLRRQLAELFGLPLARVVAEYGMTELSSQLYQPGVRDDDPATHYLAPPWLRVTAVDPITLSPVPDGEVGLARFDDLANVDSAVAVLTMDRIRVQGPRVELLGRQPGAIPRGCSLSLEPVMADDARGL